MKFTLPCALLLGKAAFCMRLHDALALLACRLLGATTLSGCCSLVLLLLQVEMAMRASMSILQGSFDPIMDANNNLDLLPLIIQAKVGMASSRVGGPMRHTAALEEERLGCWTAVPRSLCDHSGSRVGLARSLQCSSLA